MVNHTIIWTLIHLEIQQKDHRSETQTLTTCMSTGIKNITHTSCKREGLQEIFKETSMMHERITCNCAMLHHVVQQSWQRTIVVIAWALDFALWLNPSWARHQNERMRCKRERTRGSLTDVSTFLPMTIPENYKRCWTHEWARSAAGVSSQCTFPQHTEPVVAPCELQPPDVPHSSCWYRWLGNLSYVSGVFGKRYAEYHSINPHLLLSNNSCTGISRTLVDTVPISFISHF